ncbi:ABC1-domain-containing protein [Xylaria nigripes]|nr:ABC1-domain-containing protein [Xylaria nigripes]
MRFADVILDLAAVAKAARSVASRHLELRANQIDRYTYTSSILRSLKAYEKAESENADSASTHITEDTSESHQQQRQSDSNLAEPGLVDATETIPGGLIASGNIYKDSIQDANRGLLHHSSFCDAAAQQRTAARPDQSAILIQLRGKESVSWEVGREKARSGAADNWRNDVPSGVNLNVFHTRRGAQTLDRQEDVLRQPRPTRPALKPSWFKDFGHDKPQRQQKFDKSRDVNHVPSIPRPSGQGSSSIEGVASVVDVAGGDMKLGETPRLRDEEEAESLSLFAPRTKADSGNGGQKTFGLRLASPLSNYKEPDVRQIVRERTQTVENNLSSGGLNSTKSQETSVSPSDDRHSTSTYALRESTVPATRLSRLWNYGGLAAGMLGGALSEGISRGLGGGGQGSVMFSASNMERLVAKLSRMRGAALKLGQMMSFQDSKMLPGPIQEVLQRVQDRADYMPAWQRDRVLAASLGPTWRDLFEEFEDTPIAAASIGQVHRATLKSGRKVAVKIQFPGVADSINSDLDNISLLLKGSKMLPRGLYLNKTIDNARIELGWECDYERELECGKRYKELLSDENDVFSVPEIYPRASGKHVLTMQFMEGVGVTRVKSFTQAQRDWIGTQILRLCLREIVEFHFMQTDPNWTNFLYNAATNKLELLDFGASREFPALFVAQYVSLLAAAARRDRDAVVDYSQRLGYLTGHESRAMLDAHIASILTLAEPFLESAPAVYDFADQTITERVRGLIPVMMRERLSPPPEETYSLHRKLSGAFLLCARLGSQVKCRDLFKMALEKADFGVVRATELSSKRVY